MTPASLTDSSENVIDLFSTDPKNGEQENEDACPNRMGPNLESAFDYFLIRQIRNGA